MRELSYSRSYAKGLRRMVRRGKDPNLIISIIDSLASNMPLPAKHEDHPLRGNFQGFRECHVEPDWLLIYQVEDDRLYLAATGTHADLFGK
jgi:mRNA interferase YafQ